MGIFGTDGVRGVANAQLTPELAFRIGRAGGVVVAGDAPAGLPIVVGRDTRLSGTMLEAAIVAGLTSIGRSVVLAGIVPTPALAYLTRHLGAAAGVMITASHNPIEDNGIKFFGADGFKLSDTLEGAIEERLDSSELPRPTHRAVGRAYAQYEAIEFYANAVCAEGGDLSGLTIVVDAAFGAAYEIGPRVLKRLGAHVIPLHAEDDGARINVACGATDLRALCERMKTLRTERPQEHIVGVAFDGDADRALFVDEEGELISGDHVLLIMATDMKASSVVGTVMSNIGLERALAAEGIGLLRAAVGDRYVLEMMRANGVELGGEQSGHIIDLRCGTTGDGLMTAVSLFSILARRQARLAALASALHVAPQVLVNVHVEDKAVLQRSAKVQQALVDVEKALAGRGRALVRPSGTEPLVRVMLEGDDRSEIERLANELAALIKREQGG